MMNLVSIYSNMTTPDSNYFLVFLTLLFFASKRPGLKDFCLFFEMEEWWASEAHKIKFLENEIFKL